MNNIDAMINAVSKRLGTTPEKLREALKEGDIKKAISNMSAEDARKLDMVLNNPEIMKRMMNSKEAKEIKSKLDK